MKKTIYGIALLMVLSNTAFAQRATVTDKKAGEEVLAVIAKWADAVRDRDMKMLDSIFAEDLIITTYDGKVRGKKEELEVLKPNADVKTVSVVNEDVQIKIYGNVAVVTALTRMQFVIVGKETPVVMRYTAVFAKQDNRWQMTALQTSRVSPPKAS